MIWRMNWCFDVSTQLTRYLKQWGDSDWESWGWTVNLRIGYVCVCCEMKRKVVEWRCSQNFYLHERINRGSAGYYINAIEAKMIIKPSQSCQLLYAIEHLGEKPASPSWRWTLEPCACFFLSVSLTSRGDLTIRWYWTSTYPVFFSNIPRAPSVIFSTYWGLTLFPSSPDTAVIIVAGRSMSNIIWLLGHHGMLS